MNILKGIFTLQLHFGNLDDQITADNPVRILDLFVGKLELKPLDIESHKSRYQTQSCVAPWFDKYLSLKHYLYDNLNKIRNSRKPKQEYNRNLELCWVM